MNERQVILTAITTTLQPGPQFLAAVRAGFILDYSSLDKWARANSHAPSNVRKACLGEWSGPAALKIRQDIVRYLQSRQVLAA